MEVGDNECRDAIRNNEVYKVSLGENGCYEEDALKYQTFVLASEVDFYEAVMAENKDDIYRIGKKLTTSDYPTGKAPDSAIRNWNTTIRYAKTMPEDSLIVHWHSTKRAMWWTIAGPTLREHERYPREGYDSYDVVVHRDIKIPWQYKSLGGVLLNDLHPKARDIIVCQQICLKAQTGLVLKKWTRPSTELGILIGGNYGPQETFSRLQA